MKEKIAVLIPSRSRALRLGETLNSITKTVSGENIIDVFIGIDHDDPQKKDYYLALSRMLLEKHDCMRITMLENNCPKGKLGAIWNNLARIRAYHSSCDLYMMGNDDIVFITKDWDKILLQQYNQMEHPFYMFWVDDGINGEKHCAFPIVSSQWIGTAGYFTPECFNFFYHDTWIFDVAKRAGLQKYLPQIEIKHNHFTVDEKYWDETYKAPRAMNNSEKDMMIFESREMVELREKTSESLKKRIEDWKEYFESVKKREFEK